MILHAIVSKFQMDATVTQLMLSLKLYVFVGPFKVALIDLKKNSIFQNTHSPSS